MAIRDTYSMKDGRMVWTESKGDAPSLGVEVRNTFQAHDEGDSVTLQVLSEVIGMFAPGAASQTGVRITYDDTQKLVDHLTGILDRQKK